MEIHKMSEDKVPENLNKSELAEALFEELNDRNQEACKRCSRRHFQC